jgi:hypothetical protein
MIGRGLLRSAGFRFGAIYALLLASSAIALAIFLWWATAGVLDRETDDAIYADAKDLDARWSGGGLQELAATIEERLVQNVDDDAVYLLVDPQMRRLAGNLPSWPAAIVDADGPHELLLQRAGMVSMAHVRQYDLPNGYRLLIGRDVKLRAQLRALLTDALLWAMLMALVMASIGALIIRNLFRRTLANISVTATAIAAGDFAQRVRLSGRGDEFDQLAEVINDMLDRIGRLMDGVRQVSNAIAHDLRTPITRARTRLEDAALHAETRDDLRAAIERATADLDGIVAVFQALLRIAQIEAGSRRSAFAPVDIVPLLAEVADLYEAVAEERSIALRVQSPAHVLVYGDRALIQQAVANLVDNAVKFSPAGGRVEVAVIDGAPVVISISDQGAGIPESDREKATDRFYRGETARHTPGSGLGLSLVLAVAQLHGGRLRLEDAQPGLRAVLTLPQSEEAVAASVERARDLLVP